MEFLTRFFGLTRDVSREVMEGLTLLFWGGVILLLTGEAALLVGAATHSGSFGGVLPYLASAVVAFPLLLAGALHWGLARLVLALGYGGEKPQEAFVSGWTQAQRALALLAFANIVAIAPLGVLNVQHAVVEYVSLILVLLGIGIGAIAFDVASKALWRVGRLLLLAVVIFLIIAWLFPSVGQVIRAWTVRSPAVVNGTEREAEILYRRKEAALEKVARLIEDCNKTAEELASATGKCSITQEQLRLWQEEKRTLAPRMDTGVVTGAMESARKLLTPSPARKPAKKREAAAPRVVVKGCEPTVTVADSGDAVDIAFPNCYAGAWETTLPDLPPSHTWTCEIEDKDVLWRFSRGGNSTINPRTGTSAHVTAEFHYPLSENGSVRGTEVPDAFRLDMEVQEKKISLQWNAVRTASGSGTAPFLQLQDGVANVHCEATPAD